LYTILQAFFFLVFSTVHCSTVRQALYVYLKQISCDCWPISVENIGFSLLMNLQRHCFIDNLLCISRADWFSVSRYYFRNSALLNMIVHHYYLDEFIYCPFREFEGRDEVRAERPLLSFVFQAE